MAVNKNFVVKNGIDVADQLILASTELDSVGIGTTQPKAKLDVGGGIQAEDGIIVLSQHFYFVVNILFGLKNSFIRVIF